MNCKICRLCGLEKTVGHDLFGPEAIRTGLLSKILAQFSKEIIQIEASDNFSKFICHDCELTINHFAEFSEMVKKAQEKLAIKYSSQLFTALDVEKTIECHTNSSRTIILSVGANNKIRCEICLQNLEIISWMTHWHVITHGLGTVCCSCQECGHQDEVNSFIKENSVLCPSCFFTCAKTLSTSSSTLQKISKKLHVCEICRKSFRSLGHKNRHKMIHDGLKPFLCETCGAGFNQKVSLKTHLLTHTCNYPHQCQWCGQAFRHKVSLQSHVINVHSPISKLLQYECDQCKKQFATGHKLNRHYRIHTGEQPYRCTVCNRAFSQTGNLKTHMKKHKSSTEFPDIDTSNQLTVLDSPTEKILGSMFDHGTTIHHRENKEFISLRSQVQNHIHFTEDNSALRKESIQDVFSGFDPHSCDIYSSIS